MATRNELESALATAPLDDTGYLVYADWLQAQGDPRGELITIDDALRRAPPEDRAVWRKRRAEHVAIHPELVPVTPAHVRLEWHLGFVRGVRIHDTTPVEALGPLFAHPSLAFLTTVGFESWRFVSQDDVAQLAAYLPPTLRVFALGDPDRPRRMTGPALQLTALLAAQPRIEELFVAGAARFGGAATLRSLRLVDGSHETLAFVAAAQLPALESLALDLGAGRSLFGALPTGTLAPSLTDVTTLLAAPWPRLTTLALDDAPFGDDLVTALITSPLLPRLRTLRLWNAGLTVGGARRVTREYFGHLAKLDLSDAGLDDEAARLVSDACADVRTIPRSIYHR